MWDEKAVMKIDEAILGFWFEDGYFRRIVLNIEFLVITKRLVVNRKHELNLFSDFTYRGLFII